MKTDWARKMLTFLVDALDIDIQRGYQGLLAWCRETREGRSLVQFARAHPVAFGVSLRAASVAAERKLADQGKLREHLKRALVDVERLFTEVSLDDLAFSTAEDEAPRGGGWRDLAQRLADPFHRLGRVFTGSIRDGALVQVDGNWHRGRVLSPEIELERRGGTVVCDTAAVNRIYLRRTLLGKTEAIVQTIDVRQVTGQLLTKSLEFAFYGGTAPSTQEVDVRRVSKVKFSAESSDAGDSGTSRFTTPSATPPRPSR